MSRRGRALAFTLAALLAAATAAAIADGYGNSVAHGYGELRAVVIAGAELRAGRAIDPALAADALEVRRVPARFVPPGALESPAEAIGLVAAVAVPAGSYLVASQLRPPAVPEGCAGRLRRSPSAAPMPCSSPAANRSGGGSTSW